MNISVTSHSVNDRVSLFRIPEDDKKRLRIMFLAKHALSRGMPHPEDGNHAIYHHEMLTTLQDIGLHVVPANDFTALFDDPKADYIVSLLNRAGFPMSEMLGPLLAARLQIPVMGASPVLRGVGDDKHLCKVLAEKRCVPVTPWMCVRKGAEGIHPPDFDFDRLVVKPNASSASWGVGIFDNWNEAETHVRSLLDEGHDVIVERFSGEYDVVVPVVGGDSPWIMPVCRFVMPGADTQFRSYADKRGMSDAPKEQLVAIDDAALIAKVSNLTAGLLPEFWPFDYGRFEFRYAPNTGDLHFMEVNLSCNLWSKKTMSGAARFQGVGHQDLVEHIVASSMERQGVIRAERETRELTRA